MSIGIIMSIVTYRQENKNYANAVEKREREYTEYIKKKEAEVQSARENELRIRNLIMISCAFIRAMQRKSFYPSFSLGTDMTV